METSAKALHRADDQPLYRQVKDYIVERLLTGDWPAGSRVPSENALTQQFAVSRMPVRRARRDRTGGAWRFRSAGRRTCSTRPTCSSRR